MGWPRRISSLALGNRDQGGTQDPVRNGVALLQDRDHRIGLLVRGHHDLIEDAGGLTHFVLTFDGQAPGQIPIAAGHVPQAFGELFQGLGDKVADEQVDHAGHLLGWRGAFVTLAVMNFLGALLALWLLPPSRHFVANRDVGGAFRTLGHHLHNPRLLAACAVGFCVLFSLVGTFTYVNVLLAYPPFNLSAAGLANVFCVYLVGVVVTPMAGKVIVRIGFLRSLLGALTLSAAGLALTLLPSLGAVIVGLAICSSGVFICQSATISFIADSVSEGRSLATGLYNMPLTPGSTLTASSPLT